MAELVNHFPKDAEYYTSADEVIALDDIIECDIKVLGSDKMFRIRALTFGQMSKINQAATDKEGKFNNDEWTYHTIAEGVIRPRFKVEQARRLADSNGEFVKALADEIWSIGRLNKKLWDEYLREVTTANKIAQEQMDEAVKEYDEAAATDSV